MVWSTYTRGTQSADYQGKNGWSKMKNYGELTDQLQPNLKFYNYATSYEQIKNILKEYI